MPLPRKPLIHSLFWNILGLFFLVHSALAAPGEQAIHHSGDKEVWDRRGNRVELFGHAAVNQLGETLTADYILLDLNARVLDARGNCVYLAQDSVIEGDEMHFNLDSRTGTIIGGRVANEQFVLRGERINKLGQGRFQTHWGEYTTCKDCSATWSLLGEDMDMQADGYAFISNMITQIKDTPTVWIPYLIVPMKTRRQSGFLFPSLSFGGVYGTTVMLPYFWAIDRSADTTVRLGTYSDRGLRFENEFRYVLSGQNWGKYNLFAIRDQLFDFRSTRWAFEVNQAHQLPFGIYERLRLVEVSDNLYVFQYPADVRGTGEAFLTSNLVFTKQMDDLSMSLSFQRNRNLLNSAPDDTGQALRFDTRTVQPFPVLSATTYDRQLFDTDIVGGVTLGVSNFTRGAGAFDFDPASGVPFGTTPPPGQVPNLGVDPIRKATRYSVTPSLYTTVRPFDVLSLVPSVQYRGFFYDFGNNMRPLARGFLLFQSDLATQFEKVYEFPDDESIPRVKHLIRPVFTYSFIPKFGQQEDPTHPFLQQINFAQSRGIFGYNFDNNDIVPITYSQNNANYFVPLGHSLAYGLTSQIIRRRGAVEVEIPGYQTTVDFTAGQAINLLEVGKSPPPGQPSRLFTRFFSTLNLNFDRFTSATNYFYYPDIPSATPRHTVSTNFAYTLDPRAAGGRLLTFNRSVGIGYTFNKVTSPTSNLTGNINFSINDYIMPFANASYTFIDPKKLLGAGGGVQIQTPSQCWRLIGTVNYVNGNGNALTWSIDLSINLTGSGYGGVTELANQAQAASATQ